MGQITGGTIYFERKTQPAQFEGKHAKVELTFVLAEGEELGSFLDTVANMAQAKALEMVGLKQAVATQPAPAQTPSQGTAGAKETAAKPARQPRTPKKDKETPADTAPKPDTTEATAKALTALDDLPDDTAEPQISTGEERKGPEDTVQDEFPDTTTEITDEQLDKIGHAFINSGVPGAGKKIRDLRDKYTGKPGQPLRTLAKEKRQEFVDELAKLK